MKEFYSITILFYIKFRRIIWFWRFFKTMFINKNFHGVFNNSSFVCMFLFFGHVSFHWFDYVQSRIKNLFLDFKKKYF